MKRLFFIAALFCAATLSAHAQTSTPPAFPFTYYIHDTTGQVADYPLPSIYQFSATPLGSGTHIVLKVVNTSSASAYMAYVFVGDSTTSSTQDPNFTITGLAIDTVVPAKGSLLFQVNFAPTTTGTISAHLQTLFQVQVAGCNFTSTNPNTQCPSGLDTSFTLNGTGSQPQLVLSLSGSTTPLQPNSTPVNFGNILPGSSSAITFTLTNESTVAITIPAISVTLATVYSTSPFILDKSHFPSSGSIAAGASANFTITFEPGQAIAYLGSSLLVGANTFPLAAYGSVPTAVANISSLSVCYVDSTGVQTQAEPATAIPFSLGSISGANKLTFMIVNPATSANAVVVPAITISGAFSISSYSLTGTLGSGVCPIPASAGTATPLPATINAGSGLVFTVTYVPTAVGTSTGTLTVGSSSPMQAFQLSGTNTAPLLTGLALHFTTPLPLTSQQQASMTVNLSAGAPVKLSGILTMTFTPNPSLTGITNDPAVVLMANNTRTLNITFAAGSTVATYDSAGDSNIIFQTGTTAGTIAFIIDFPDTPIPNLPSYSITPAKVQISSATAVAQSAQVLVLTVDGYDNSYSTGALNFTFYDTSGNAYPAIAYSAAAAFQSNFFSTTNTSGGAFTLQASFPVTGDITKIGTVALSIGNSVGQTTQTLTIKQ